MWLKRSVHKVKLFSPAAFYFFLLPFSKLQNMIHVWSVTTNAFQKLKASTFHDKKCFSETFSSFQTLITVDFFLFPFFSTHSVVSLPTIFKLFKGIFQARKGFMILKRKISCCLPLTLVYLSPLAKCCLLRIFVASTWHLLIRLLRAIKHQRRFMSQLFHFFMFIQ